jgi:hypothetical protein
MGRTSKTGEKGASVAQISTKSGEGRLHAWAETSQLATVGPELDRVHWFGNYQRNHRGIGRKMHTFLELKLGLASPSLVLATLWAVFFTRYTCDRKLPSAWLALLLTSFSGFAALYAVVDLSELMKRSITDVNYEAMGLIPAISGFIASLVWFVRSRNLCAVGTLITASWLCFIWYLQFP